MLIRKFEEIHKEKKQSLIVISHQEKIISMADRIMVMSEGKIEQIDTPEEIFQNPANQFIRDFVIAHLEQKYQSLKKCTGRV